MLKELRQFAPVTAKRLIYSVEDGKPKYRFWQKGKGFDRNLFSPQEILSAINYTHANPIRRRLCENELDYPWSSARFYAEAGEVVFDVDRCPVVKMAAR